MAETTEEFVKNIRDALEVMSADGKFHRKIMEDACDRLEQQQKTVREILELCEKVQDWLDTSSLREVVVNFCDDPRKDALIMGIANSLIRIEEAIAKAEEILKGE